MIYVTRVNKNADPQRGETVLQPNGDATVTKGATMMAKSA